jgi:hypothetical protein
LADGLLVIAAGGQGQVVLALGPGAGVGARLRAAVPPGVTEGSYYVPRPGMRELPVL